MKADQPDISTAERAKARESRVKWGGRFEFLASCISASVGLGNVWRFPFTAYENGGGAFIIPYLIVLFLIGKPMYLLEAVMGQFPQRSMVTMWAICPSFLGVGFGEVYSATAVISYYAALLALDLYYLGISFQKHLPWARCRHEWGANCVSSARMMGKGVNQAQSSAELYYLKEVLRETNDISKGIGVPNWHLAISLFIVWMLSFLAIFKGIRTWGKAAYFFAIFPYIVLFILLIRTATLDGAGAGIIYFLKPQWSELANLKVWKEAVVQCFFSLCVTFGPIVTFASHNRFDHHVRRDTMIVTLIDTFTSLLSGITIFGVLGNLAKKLNVENIDEVVRSGLGLAFISYPDAISKFDHAPQVFGVLFFGMILVLGVGSLAAMENAVITSLCDYFHIKRYWILSVFITAGSYLIGLLYITPAGQWILNMVDYTAGTYVAFFLVIFEVTGIMWCYGVRNFCDDIEFMTKKTVSIYYRICWVFITPVTLVFIFVYSMAIVQPITYANHRYPIKAEVSGWMLLVIGCLQFPLWGIVYLCIHRQKTVAKTFKDGVTATEDWAPADTEIKQKWLAFKQERQQLREQERQEKKMSNFSQKFRFIFGRSI